MEGWEVTVKLSRWHANCTAWKGDRKVTLTYFFYKKRFVLNNKAKTLSDLRHKMPPDWHEIKAACLTAIAVARLTA